MPARPVCARSDALRAQIPVLGLVFTQKCYDVFLTNGLLAGSLDVFDLPCIKVTLAKGLGWGIVVFSGILKVCIGQCCTVVSLSVADQSCTSVDASDLSDHL